MKHFKIFAILFTILFTFANIISLFAQDSTATSGIQIPEGFNWIFLIFFGVGMLAHYVYKVYTTFKQSNLLKNLMGNFIGWFVNKFHWTILSGAAVTILALAENYGLNVSFTTLNIIGIGCAVVSGYLGDIANKGNLVDYGQ